LVTCIVAVKADIVGELKDVLDSQSEFVGICFLGVVVLVVYEHPHHLPVGLSGVGPAVIRQTFKREHINSSVRKAVDNVEDISGCLELSREG